MMSLRKADLLATAVFSTLEECDVDELYTLAEALRFASSPWWSPLWKYASARETESGTDGTGWWLALTTLKIALDALARDEERRDYLREAEHPFWQAVVAAADEIALAGGLAELRPDRLGRPVAAHTEPSHDAKAL